MNPATILVVLAVSVLGFAAPPYREKILDSYNDERTVMNVDNEFREDIYRPAPAYGGYGAPMYTRPSYNSGYGSGYAGGYGGGYGGRYGGYGYDRDNNLNRNSNRDANANANANRDENNNRNRNAAASKSKISDKIYIQNQNRNSNENEDEVRVDSRRGYEHQTSYGAGY